MIRFVSLSICALLLQACDKAAFDPGTPRMPAGNVPSHVHSKLLVSSPNWANGMSAAEITLELKNDDGNPVVGVSVNLSASGSENVLTTCPPSDRRGFIRCRLYSTRAEWKKIVVSGGISFEHTTEFLPIAPFKSSFAVVSAGSYTRLPSGHRFLTSLGNAYGPHDLRDAGGKLRAQTTILGQILGE